MNDGARFLASWPEYSFERGISKTGEWAPEAAAVRKFWVESIAKAGLPICATPEQLLANPSMRSLSECDAERARVAVPKT